MCLAMADDDEAVAGMTRQPLYFPHREPQHFDAGVVVVVHVGRVRPGELGDDLGGVGDERGEVEVSALVGEVREGARVRVAELVERGERDVEDGHRVDVQDVQCEIPDRCAPPRVRTAPQREEPVSRTRVRIERADHLDAADAVDAMQVDPGIVEREAGIGAAAEVGRGVDGRRARRQRARSHRVRRGVAGPMRHALHDQALRVGRSRFRSRRHADHARALGARPRRARVML